MPDRPGDVAGGQAGSVRDQRVRPLMEGPLHEAFLSPRKDRNPRPRRQGTAAADHRAARGRSAERERRVDRGLLGMGRRPEGLRLGHRHLARPSAGPILGQRLLETRRPGLVSRARLLERAEDRPARLPQERPTPGTPRRRARRAPQPGLLLRPRPVLPRRRRRRLEEGLLGQGPARLVVGSRPVGQAARRLGLPGRLLGSDVSRIAGLCSRPPRSIRPREDPRT